MSEFGKKQQYAQPTAGLKKPKEPLRGYQTQQQQQERQKASERMNFDDDDLVQRSSILSVPGAAKEKVIDNDEDDDSGGDSGAGFEGESGFLQGHKHRRSADSQESEPARTQLSELRTAIAELYLGIKQKTRDENDVVSPEEEKEERDIIMSLDSYMVIEYIKSSVDIILNLKFEEIEKRLLDKTGGVGLSPEKTQTKHKGSPKMLASQRSVELAEDSEAPSQRSSLSQMEGPPRIYEEVIQNLEADIRKHIRIEQQLKLHIESIENRVEELETQQTKMEKEAEKLKEQQTAESKESEERFEKAQELLKAKEELIEKFEKQVKILKESEMELKKEIEKLKTQLAEQTVKAPAAIEHQMHQAMGGTQQDLQSLLLSQTQPMILSKGLSSGPAPLIVSQQQQQQQEKPLFIKKLSQQQPNAMTHEIESYSSNKSFEHDSPERRTPDLTHPYLQTQVIQSQQQIPLFSSSQQHQKKKQASNSKGKRVINQSDFISAASNGLQASLNAIAQTYIGGGGSGKLNQRRQSNQNRTSSSSKASKFVPGPPTKQSWAGHPHQQLASGPQPTYSNIINNNIQGLSINYSNQIIQNGGGGTTDASLQHLAKSFLSTNIQRNDSYDPQLQGGGSEDSESSNLNSHRRCKSQNVKRDGPDTTSSSSMGKHAKKVANGSRNQPQIVQDLSADELLKVQVPGSSYLMTEGKTRKQGFTSEDYTQPLSTEKGQQHQQYFHPSSHNAQAAAMLYDFVNGGLPPGESSNNKRRAKHNPSLGSQQHHQNYTQMQQQQQSKNMSNRFITQQPSNHPAGGTITAEEIAKLRFNQSFGGSNPSVLQQRTNNFMNTSGAGASSISHSVEKHHSRSRNKQQQQMTAHLMTQQGVPFLGVASKFDQTMAGGILDMHFKTQTQQQVKQNKGSLGSGFMSSKQANTSVQFINQPSTAVMKQQLLATKKASNLLMKGLSPLKKTQL